MKRLCFVFFPVVNHPTKIASPINSSGVLGEGFGRGTSKRNAYPILVSRIVYFHTMGEKSQKELDVAVFVLAIPKSDIGILRFDVGLHRSFRRITSRFTQSKLHPHYPTWLERITVRKLCQRVSSTKPHNKAL